MHLACRPASECMLEPEVLNFDSKNWWIAQKVVVKGVPDNIVDGTQNFKVYAALSSGNPKYNRGEKQIGRGQNSDVDTIGIDLFIDEANTSGGGKIFRTAEGSIGGFRFELRSKPIAPVRVTVTITAIKGRVAPSIFPSTRTVNPDEWDSALNLFKISCKRDNDAQEMSFKISLKADSKDSSYDGQQSVDMVGICVDGDTAGLRTTFLNSRGSDSVIIQGVQFSERSHDNKSTLALNFATNPTADVTLTFYSTNNREVKVVSPLEPQKVSSQTPMCSFAKRGYQSTKNFCNTTVELCGLEYCESGGDKRCPHACNQPYLGLPPKFTIILQSVDDNEQDGSQDFCIKVGLCIHGCLQLAINAFVNWQTLTFAVDCA